MLKKITTGVVLVLIIGLTVRGIIRYRQNAAKKPIAIEDIQEQNGIPVVGLLRQNKRPGSDAPGRLTGNVSGTPYPGRKSFREKLSHLVSSCLTSATGPTVP